MPNYLEDVKILIKDIDRLQGLMLSWGAKPEQCEFEYFSMYLEKHKFDVKQTQEYLDYAAWRNGEANQSVFMNTPLLSLMIDGKEAKKVIKKAGGYMKYPAYIMQYEKKKGEILEQQYFDKSIPQSKKKKPRSIRNEEIREHNERIAMRKKQNKE